jgi:hypothetical protein
MAADLMNSFFTFLGGVSLPDTTICAAHENSKSRPF